MKAVNQFSFIFFLIVIFSIPSLSNDFIKEGRGTVVLQDQSVYFGMISFNQELNLVSVKKGDRTYAFNPSQVQVFQIFDEDKELNRLFTSVEVTDPAIDFAKPMFKFLELVVHGDLSILRSESYKMVEQYESSDRNLLLKRNVMSEPVLVVDFDYYITKNGYTQKIIDFEKQVVAQMNNQPLIQAYIFQNELDLSKWEDQYKLVEYYNQLDPSEKRFFSTPSQHTL